MKRALIVAIFLAALVLLLVGTDVLAGPVMKAKPFPKGPAMMKPFPGKLIKAPKKNPQAVPMPKFPKYPHKPHPFPPGAFKPMPKPKPMPMPHPPKHPHNPHRPHWTKAIPKIQLHLGGGSSHTTVVERVPYEPLPEYEGVHPAPTFIRGKAYYPFPGEGGTWVTYRERNCYVYEGLLYVLVKKESARLPFRRTTIPRDLAEELELFGPPEVRE